LVGGGKDLVGQLWRLLASEHFAERLVDEAIVEIVAFRVV
jgi:hypothetical protein